MAQPLQTYLVTYDLFGYPGQRCKSFLTVFVLVTRVNFRKNITTNDRLLVAQIDEPVYGYGWLSEDVWTCLNKHLSKPKQDGLSLMNTED